MMVNERSESTQDNIGKLIYQLQPKTKTPVRKLIRILMKLYRQNISLLFNQTCSYIFCVLFLSSSLLFLTFWLPYFLAFLRCLVYLGIEIIQSKKSFLKFDCWSKKAFKKYKDIIQIMTSFFFKLINPRSIARSFSRSVMRWIQNVKSNGISFSWCF